ncbi:MAG: FkbM family methyltransferase [Ginsengibacter sp.]
MFVEKIYEQFLPPDAYVIDCGANIGLSVIFIKRHCPTARILAFEPDMLNYTLLKKNISSHLLNDIEARQEAVWVEDTTLHFKQEGNMGSKIGTDTTISNSNVKAIRLKDCLNKKVDFLKLDIEGAEYVVLKDISENLHFITNMFVEYHGRFAQNKELLEIFQIIEKAGFKFYIKEAAINYQQPFLHTKRNSDYDIQLNIFCFRN